MECSSQVVEYSYKQLVYVNLVNADDSKIKKMNNIFQGTLENMVFCINETLSSNIYRIISRKGCSVIDCSKNWTYSRKLIITSTGQCVNECPAKAIFFHDYKCYFRCPNLTLPDNFICKEYSNETIIEEDLCTNKKFFQGICKKKFYSPISKQKFIESTVNDFLDGKLYDLALMSLEKEKKFFIRGETETYAIYALSNKNREEDLVHINMDECRDHLSRINQINKDDIVIFQIEYKSPNFKIPIVEYGLFAIYGTKKLSINYCNNLKARYYIPLNITDYKDYKYNPENKYYYDKCHSYTSENNTDITLKDRREDFNNNNRSLCESMCTFKGYKNNYIKCECDIKLKFNSFLNSNVSKYNLIYRFDMTKKISVSTSVLECFLYIFSKEVITSNKCSIIILSIIGLRLFEISRVI